MGRFKTRSKPYRKKSGIKVKAHKRTIRRKKRRPNQPKKYPKPYRRGKTGSILKTPFITKTIYVQDPTTGQLKGRNRIEVGADKTGILLESKDKRIFGRTLAPGSRAWNKMFG